MTCMYMKDCFGRDIFWVGHYQMGFYWDIFKGWIYFSGDTLL